MTCCFVNFRYTNTDNPFGDGKLLDTFVWHKKLEKEGLQDLAASQKKDLIRRKQDSNKIELEKVMLVLVNMLIAINDFLC